ncbi:MAG TPA: metallophosphoesterase, partial [Chitinophagaceae bacterium]|nr:metallophosphoesterase [Chitinophagaceae bacterium]
DFFDRGDQVTEVLWLIYSLEEKAKAAGGYVHFILGNHEIMNMGGDLRYVQQKYKDNAQLMHENYESLYGERSELGRWLRSKNIMEKIGPFLFTHGGVSAELNQLNWSLEKINKTARPKYADGEYEFANDKLTILYGDETSPFWYRGYYMHRPPGIEEQVNNTLKVFNVKHVVTGHTIVADTVSSWYGGKVFNTDTHHSEGKSGAIFVEGNKIFRVDAEGNKFLLKEE